jgi:hypothetical protein
MAAFPDIGPAITAAGFFCAALEAVVFGVARSFYVEQVTQFEEVGLRPGALAEGVVLPAGYEFLWGPGGAGIRDQLSGIRGTIPVAFPACAGG